MHKQPYVIRAFYATQADAMSASTQLDNIGTWNDFIEGSKLDPHPYKVIFVDTSLVQAKLSIKRIAQKPALVQVFDPQDNLEGWPEFKTATL